jgi:hypothetical protein
MNTTFDCILASLLTNAVSSKPMAVELIPPMRAKFGKTKGAVFSDNAFSFFTQLSAIAAQCRKTDYAAAGIAALA